MATRLSPVKDNVEIAGLTIAELLRRHEIRIPRYQRYYRWREQRWEQLLGDLLEHLEVQRQRPSEYHLGDMRFERCVDGKLEVADGQQRLVSVCVLVAALARCAGELKLNWNADEYLFTKEPSASGSVKVSRISDQFDEWTSAFSAIIASPDPETAGDTPFARAYRYFVAGIRTYLNKVDPAERGVLLEDIIEVILNRTVVTKAVYSNGLGQQSFARVHTRGEPVSQAELLKADLMALAVNSTDAGLIWESWRTAVEIFDEERRGLAMWVESDLSDSGAPIRDAEASTIVLRAARDARAAGKGVASVVKRFASFSKAWSNLRSGKTPDGSKNLATARNISQQTPLKAQKQLFWLLPAGRHLSRADFATYARSVEDTMVVASIVGPSPPDVEAFVARTLGKLREVSSLTSPAGVELLSQLKDFRDKHAQPFGDKLVYACQHELRSKALETVIRYLEAHSSSVLDGRSAGQGRGDVPLNGTLEHVLPQRLTDDVLAEYGSHAAAIRDRFRLGNLALVELAPNSELSNKTFEEKKGLYGEVPFRVTSSLVHDLASRSGAQARLGKYLIKIDQWGPAAVQQRSETLYQLACDTFDIKVVKPAPIEVDSLEPFSVPQANDPNVVLAALLALKHVNSTADVVAILDYGDRQGPYYLEACEVLGLATVDAQVWTLTNEGRQIVESDNPAEALKASMRDNPFLFNWNELSAEEKSHLMRVAGLAESTGRRRTSTLDSWVRWACFT